MPSTKKINKDKELMEYFTNDILSHIPGITSRSMFGGYGVYKNGKIFCIIAWGELYFKTDKDSEYVKELEDLGGKQFVYEKGKHKKSYMNYWTIDLDILEDQGKARYYINKSLSYHNKK